MEQKNTTILRGSNTARSRRDLLRGAAVLGAMYSSPAGARAEDDHDDGGHVPAGPIWAYVGAYTPNGQGIHLFRMNPANGALTFVKVFPAVNPSWLAFDPQKKFLYAANEISNFNGGTTGSVSAYAVNKTNGDLTLLNTVSSQGADPAHLSVDPSGKYVLVANYGGGNVAVLPIQASGSLGGATDFKADNSACSPGPCAVGPTQAVSGPPGSFAISGHDAPHAHMIQTDPSGKWAIVNDLGLDLTIVWEFNRAAGTLNNPKTTPSSPGAGPRHFAFHPNGINFYSLNEEASTLSVMTWNGATGTLHPLLELSTLPAGFKGTDFTSEVIVTRNGRFIYVLNRLHNSIGIFSASSPGAPKLIGEAWTGADYPRSCNLDPTGRFLYVCHNRSDNVTAFRVDPEDGGLQFTGQYTAVGSPAVIVFLS